MVLHTFMLAIIILFKVIKLKTHRFIVLHKSSEKQMLAVQTWMLASVTESPIGPIGC